MYQLHSWLEIVGQTCVSDGVYQVIETTEKQFTVARLSLASALSEPVEIDVDDLDVHEARVQQLLQGHQTLSFSTQRGDVFYFGKPYAFVGFNGAGGFHAATLHGLYVVTYAKPHLVSLTPLKMEGERLGKQPTEVTILPSDTVLDAFNKPDHFVYIAPYFVTQIALPLVGG